MSKKCMYCKSDIEDSSVIDFCERCGKNVCLDCTGNEYPYSMTLCDECDSDFVAIHEDWLDGGEKK